LDVRLYKEPNGDNKLGVVVKFERKPRDWQGMARVIDFCHVDSTRKILTNFLKSKVKNPSIRNLAFEEIINFEKQNYEDRKPRKVMKNIEAMNQPPIKNSIS
jgi:hypothetical protein